MASLRNGTRRRSPLLCLVTSVGLALTAPAWADTLLQSAGTLDATVTSTPLVAVSPVYSLCTMIYSRDVQERTYHIVSPGRYCLASDLNATPPAIVLLPTPKEFGVKTNSIHSGAAIHVHVSDVDIDFRRYALNDAGATPIEDGVRLDPGLSNVTVHDGVINGFENGLAGSGTVSAVLSGIRIQRMKFYGGQIGAHLGIVRDSVISRNTFAADIIGLALSVADRTVVAGNRFDLPGTSTGYAIGLYTSWGARHLSITDNIFNGRGQFGGMGLHLHNNSWQATNEDLSRANRVERNVLYAVEEPIVVSGSGIASDNVIRENQIFGDTASTIVRTYPTGYPRRFSGIRVENNAEIEIYGNYVFTGLRIPYYHGIELGSATTVKLDVNGASTLRSNQTCGVADPLRAPYGVPESSIDGGNWWNNWCLPLQIQ
ncbi:MAG: NosD domain-containing protein [Pseudomonadales bacterium]